MVPGGHKHWSGRDKKEGGLFYTESPGKFDLIPAKYIRSDQSVWLSHPCRAFRERVGNLLSYAHAIPLNSHSTLESGLSGPPPMRAGSIL